MQSTNYFLLYSRASRVDDRKQQRANAWLGHPERQNIARGPRPSTEDHSMDGRQHPAKKSAG